MRLKLTGTEKKAPTQLQNILVSIWHKEFLDFQTENFGYLNGICLGRGRQAAGERGEKLVLTFDASVLHFPFATVFAISSRSISFVWSLEIDTCIIKIKIIKAEKLHGNSNQC